MNKEDLRVAVVGLGKMGLLHASLLNTLPSVRLVALCDKNALILGFFRKVFTKIRIVDDAEKLADMNLDAVYVTTPIPTHFRIAEMVYSEGIADNLFVEKTLASDYDKAKKLCSMAKRSGGVNMVGYMKRFSVTFLKAKELLGEGAIGEVAAFKAYAYSSDFAEVERGSRVSASRGGVLEDLGAHIIDSALMLFGDFVVEEAKMQSFGEEGSEDAATLHVRSQDGLNGSFQISWCMRNYRLPEFGLIINGSKGDLSVNDDRVKLDLADGKSRGWYRQDLNDNVGYLLGEPEYFRENAHFVASILGKGRAEPDFMTASKVDCIIGQAKQRAERSERQ